MELVIHSSGKAQCIYGEHLELTNLGRLSIRRASHVEPTGDGRWMADLSPTNGPLLGPFVKRTDALHAEVQWLRANWLTYQNNP